MIMMENLKSRQLKGFPNYSIENGLSTIAYLNKLCNTSLHRPQPTKLEHTILRSTWMIPINHNKEGIEPYCIMLIYVTKTNSKFLKLKNIISIDQNERDKRENEMNNDPIVVISISRMGTKRINAQNMYDELLKYAEAKNIEKENVPQISTTHNWINAYASAFKQKVMENEFESEKNKLS
ncbi:1780_t:CDS:2 [Gigaspora rosea]|nr:1780_t:CDS:2 [Gigaspora rosea]